MRRLLSIIISVFKALKTIRKQKTNTQILSAAIVFFKKVKNRLFN